MMMRMLLLLNFVVAVPVLGEIAVFVIVFVAIAVIFAVDDDAVYDYNVAVADFYFDAFPSAYVDVAVLDDFLYQHVHS